MAGAEPHIGTLNEAHLHASLKEIYAEPGDQFEVPLEGFVVDILRGDLIVEIQTRSFGSMKKKLRTLLQSHTIRLVHPIAHERWIVKLAQSKKHQETRRKSPKKQGLEAIFIELVSIPDLIDHPNLEIELVLVREDEIRRHDPKRAWRRKGWVVQERQLIDVLDRRVLKSSNDLIDLIGGELPEQFTTRDIAEISGWQRRVAQQAAYCLRACGRIAIAGKQGNALVYTLDDAQQTPTISQPDAGKPSRKGVTTTRKKKKKTAARKTSTRSATGKKKVARKVDKKSAARKKKTSAR